jgi:tetraacyldisaccharide 4'-kinase
LEFLFKILLAPFTLLYAIGIAIRNFLYNNNYFRAISFDIPVISVGNLSTGGTGKTPHVDYLIDLLKTHYSLGVLSRGYRRKTNGYLDVQTSHTALDVGDEPLLLKWKHPEVAVAVSEDRALGIPSLASQKPHSFTVLLDDAFQHRSIRAGLSILLTPYHDLYTDDFLLPMGNLREFKSGAERADIIIVSHSPSNLSQSEKDAIKIKIAPKDYQKVFFSYLKYYQTYQVFQEEIYPIIPEEDSHILMLTGIANNSKMKDYLSTLCDKIYERKFADHHTYSDQDIESVINTYNDLKAPNKYIVTTEKDLTRLFPFAHLFNKAGIKLLCLPIKVNFAAEEKSRFNQVIHFFIEKTIEDYLTPEE